MSGFKICVRLNKKTIVMTASLHDTIAPSGPGAFRYWGFTITLRHTTLGANPLDEWSAWRRDLYLTTHNTHKRQTSRPRRNSNPQSEQSSGLRLRQRGQWGRLIVMSMAICREVIQVMIVMIHAYKEDDSGDCDNAENQIRYVAVIISALYLRCLRLEHRPGDDGPCCLTVFAIAMNLHNIFWEIL